MQTPTVPAPVATHNVLDLLVLPLVSPPPPLVVQAPLKATPTTSSHIVRASLSPSTMTSGVDSKGTTASSAVPSEASAASTTCGKCRKLTLSEVARLVPQLASLKALLCHCCGLTLPWFCFTVPQQQARRPECRGCRGVSSVIGMLTARVKKLLDEQHRGSHASTATLSATAAVSSIPPARSVGSAVPAKTPVAPPVQPVRSTTLASASPGGSVGSIVPVSTPVAPPVQPVESTASASTPVAPPIQPVGSTTLASAPMIFTPPVRSVRSTAATTTPATSTAASV